jgi:hypothetical protein
MTSGASTEHGERATDERATSTLQLIAAWALVGVPLAWGVWQVVVKSMDLFR